MRRILLSAIAATTLFSTAYARPLPAGNYMDSCHSCTMHRHRVLSCICRTEAGNEVHTARYIPESCRTVANYNGAVKCQTYWSHPRYHHHRHHRYHPWHKVVFNQSAGPIMNNFDAQAKCPTTCQNAGAKWSGQWNTPTFSMNSVCGCVKWAR